MRIRLVLIIVVCVIMCGYGTWCSTAAHAVDQRTSGRALESLLESFTGRQYTRPADRQYQYAAKKDKKKRKRRAKRKSEKEEDDLGKALSIIQGVGAMSTGIQGIDYESEKAIGESLALESFHRYGLPVENRSLQQYVNLVGNAVARNSGRPGIPYRFVVIESPLYNAFACPGGIIFLSSTLMKAMYDESELACVLAHEVAHVSHKHALETIRRAKFFEGVGKITAATMDGSKGEEFKAMIGDLQTALFDRGLDQNMEFEADTSGMESAYRTGYDPGGMIRVLRALQRNEATAHKAGSWFSTHPPLSTRISNCTKHLHNYPDARNLATVSDRFIRHKALIP